MLAARKKNGSLNRPARERYSKHVKALIQVGDTRSTGDSVELGYPAEIIPLNNPYDLKAGGTLRIRAVVEGRPVPNQLVMSGGRTVGGGSIPARSVRTDAEGVARIRVRSPGVWYVKFIHMEPMVGSTTVDYESKWATLTFGTK